MSSFSDSLNVPYSILGQDGKLVGRLAPELDRSRLLLWYRTMWLTRFFSSKMVALQRQGKATTWIPSFGQEAAAVGMATSLQPQDWLACSPREIGSYFLKGVPPAAIAYFTRGCPYPPDLFKADYRCLPLTIVIGTQTPHAVGLAMAAKITGESSISVGSCGDGGSSEGDFNEALNFAGVFKAPVVLVVVNNGWAISVPRRKQTAASTIAARGKGFGVPAHLVDGNDILAMYEVMKEADQRARSGGGPTLVEALTYRMHPHSTADDPSRYQPSEELSVWGSRDPIDRFRHFLLNEAIIDEAEDQALRLSAEEEISAQVQLALELPLPEQGDLFNNVFEKPIPRLGRQKASLQK